MIVIVNYSLKNEEETARSSHVAQAKCYELRRESLLQSPCT